MLALVLVACIVFVATRMPPEQPVSFFAYGANLAKSAMTARAGGFINATPAELPGYSLSFESQDARATEFGVATAVPTDSGGVQGALYYLTPEQMAALDKQSGAPGFYERKEVGVLAGGKVVKAQAYFLAGSVHRQAPSRTYYLSVQGGLEEWGHDSAFLANAASAD